MGGLLKFSKVMDYITDKIGKFFEWFTMPIMLLLIFEVISRRVFNKPTEWNFFITKQIFAFLYLFLAPYGLLKQVNVRVDIWYEKWSAKVRAWVDFLGTVCFMIPYAIIVVVFGGQYALNAIRAREETMSPMKLPVWHVKGMIPVAFALFGLQAVSEAIKLAQFIRKGEKA